MTLLTADSIRSYRQLFNDVKLGSSKFVRGMLNFRTEAYEGIASKVLMKKATYAARA